MWSLGGSEESPYDSYLVVSFISETKVLASAGTALSDGLFDSYIPGFDSEKQALCILRRRPPWTTASSDRGYSVRLVDGTSLELVAQWPDQGNARALRLLQPISRER